MGAGHFPSAAPNHDVDVADAGTGRRRLSRPAPEEQRATGIQRELTALTSSPSVLQWR